MNDLDALLERARAWRDADPDPVTAAAMTAAVDLADPVELADLVGRRLAFGTAGLRGPLGPGPNRMNRLLVRQTAAGLAAVLAAEPALGATARGVVIGRDGRHGSADFLEEVAEVLAGSGIPVHRFPGTTPTPVVAWAIRRLEAAAGVVVTASHNPPADNGIKVYWGDGAQIVPPVDGAIAEAIDAAAAAGNPSPTGPRAEVRDLGEATLAEYVATARGLVGPAPAPIRIATTAMHGVGHELLHRVLSEAGYTDLHTVAEQRDPDPDFPTVAFPNPEEPGAMDLLVALAGEVDAHVALANDPDADRVAVAVPGRDGVWHALTGDQVGALLAAHLLDTLPEDGRKPLVATTVVSSQLAGRIAAAAGARFAETLTGFKWLCRPALTEPGWRQVLAYEEALGYAVGPDSLDKDGITAALAVVDMVATLHAAGRTVWDLLDDLHRRLGVHLNRNFSVRIAGPGWQDRLAAKAAAVVAAPPAALGGLPVVELTTPAPDVIRLHLEGGSRVVIRPSGTEPKLKAYVEAVHPPTEDLGSARAAAAALLARIAADTEGLLGG